ncbi:MAG: hypothetical protein B7Z73_10130 [Planctomycetia bacterium 21-64-5]|nr:MAG: hypothetical protein B7Z73_10130 [Planctomycetia bacterium 21-64-5]HQU45286.1 glycosyltransferase family 2 protein [Pirellulales bacterium]
MTPAPDVDLIVLSRSLEPLDEDVANAVAAQRGVRLRLHRVAGASRPTDANRWQTIARARNEGKDRGSAPWLMFLDDDVVLARDCVATLLAGLKQRPEYGALAADYLGEARQADARGHVGMGATLFRRGALARVRFRWAADRCECQCCCDDLRAQGIGIGYWSAARASHRGASAMKHQAAATRCAAGHGGGEQPRVLAAFDRCHYGFFRRQFLGSLRATGNQERVAVVAYGLYPSEERVLASLPNVEVWPLGVNGVMPPIRRLRDFQRIVERWPEDTPVAYWDAGDVIFQDSLGPLWRQVEQHRHKLLAVREPTGHPHNLAVAAWTLSVFDRAARRRAFDLLSRRPFLNSGFAAGTAKAVLKYLRQAEELRASSDLQGSTDWGDQTVLNLYCHSNPDEWHEIEDGWNYCLHDRRRGEVVVAANGRLCRRNRKPIHVVHGNARSLARYMLSPYLG